VTDVIHPWIRYTFFFLNLGRWPLQAKELVVSCFLLVAADSEIVDNGRRCFFVSAVTKLERNHANFPMPDTVLQYADGYWVEPTVLVIRKGGPSAESTNLKDG
jgi:hypothetical protein